MAGRLTNALIVAGLDASAVIADFERDGTVLFELDIYDSRACIEAVFEKLFHGGLEINDDLSTSDLMHAAGINGCRSCMHSSGGSHSAFRACKNQPLMDPLMAVLEQSRFASCSQTCVCRVRRSWLEGKKLEAVYASRKQQSGESVSFSPADRQSERCACIHLEEDGVELRTVFCTVLDSQYFRSCPMLYCTVHVSTA